MTPLEHSGLTRNNVEPARVVRRRWRSDGPGPAEEFVRKDPYVANGLVDKWSIRPWHVVDL